MVFTINLHFVTSNPIPTYKEPILPLTSNICLVFLPLKIQKIHQQTKVYHTFFLFCLKRNITQTFKSGSDKNPFLQCACYWHNSLQWMFFVLSGNWKTLILMKVYRYSETVSPSILLLFLKPVFWTKSVFYALWFLNFWLGFF